MYLKKYVQLHKAARCLLDGRSSKLLKTKQSTHPYFSFQSHVNHGWDSFHILDLEKKLAKHQQDLKVSQNL